MAAQYVLDQFTRRLAPPGSDAGCDALHQRATGARGFDASAVVLLKAEGDAAEVGRFVDGHGRRRDPAGELGEVRVGLR